MRPDSRQILDEYPDWLREHSEVRTVGDWEPKGRGRGPLRSSRP
jgi:hypothetical protein